MLEYTIENELNEKGFVSVCGVDEAGRGPLCGPVCAAACILPSGLYIEGLNDSKKLTAKRRDKIFEEIKSNAVAYSIAFASVEEINELNILEATLLAMRRAIDGLSVKADYALIDGNVCRGFQLPAQYVIHGDAISPSIAAASILAKVTRDRLCDELDREYPQYGIAKNKGYGTKQHMDALRQYGPTPIHRTQFIRFLDNEN
ncbi:MAG: ribonuclease HII [Clostridia bacterium]|nr:ribonuclease HII [Clostridia bacterium]